MVLNSYCKRLSMQICISVGSSNPSKKKAHFTLSSIVASPLYFVNACLSFSFRFSFHLVFCFLFMVQNTDINTITP